MPDSTPYPIRHRFIGGKPSPQAQYMFQVYTATSSFREAARRLEMHHTSIMHAVERVREFQEKIRNIDPVIVENAIFLDEECVVSLNEPGITDVEHLAGLRRSDLAHLRNIGSGRIQMLADFAVVHGVPFKMDMEEKPTKTRHVTPVTIFARSLGQITWLSDELKRAAFVTAARRCNAERRNGDLRSHPYKAIDFVRLMPDLSPAFPYYLQFSPKKLRQYREKQESIMLSPRILEAEIR